MDLPLLAEVDQLSARLQRDLDVQEATQALADGSGLVRAISKQTISFVENETVDLTGGDRVLRLPQRPVVVDDTHPITVVEVGEFGGIDIPLIEHRDWERKGDELTRAYPWYWQRSRLMGWPYNRPTGTWMPKVRVTYSHGYQTIPEDIVAIVLDIAQLIMSNPEGVRSKTVGGFSETFAQEHLGRDMVDNIRIKLSGTGRKRGAFSIGVR